MHEAEVSNSLRDVGVDVGDVPAEPALCVVTAKQKYSSIIVLSKLTRSASRDTPEGSISVRSRT